MVLPASTNHHQKIHAFSGLTGVIGYEHVSPHTLQQALNILAKVGYQLVSSSVTACNVKGLTSIIGCSTHAMVVVMEKEVD